MDKFHDAKSFASSSKKNSNEKVSHDTLTFMTLYDYTLICIQIYTF